MKRAWNPWLEHLDPDSSSKDGNHGRDVIRLFVEEQVASLTHRLVTEHNLPVKDASAYAANLMVAQSLAVQRDASPEGYRLMVTSIAVEDPALSQFRTDILNITQRVSKYQFRAGMMVAFFAATLLTILDFSSGTNMAIFGALAGVLLVVLIRSMIKDDRKGDSK